MFTDQNNICEYSVAVALNNTAISLLQRQHYRSALSALSSAFTLIRCASSTSNDDRKILSFDDINSPLHTASLCLAKASSAFPSQCTDMTSGIELKVLDDDNNSFELLEKAVYMSSTSSTVFVIRIDPVDEVDANIQLDFLTILYNFGVAHRCYSLSKQRSTSSNQVKRYNKSSFQLLKGAYDVLSRGLSVIDEDIDEDDITWSRTMLLSTLALQNLMYLSYQLGNAEDAREYYNKLGDLRTRFGNVEVQCIRTSQQLHAAAA
jgi:hypothetical protein